MIEEKLQKKEGLKRVTKKVSKEAKELQIAVLKQMIALATSGFSLVAALAWNNLIKEFIDEYIKKYFDVGSGILSLLIYALFVTFLAVIITYQLSKILKKLEERQS